MYEELLYRSEGEALDFKREQYRFINEGPHVKSELLKDILAFANSWRNESAYILIGVEENKSGKATVLGIESDLDDAQLQQFVNEKTHTPVAFCYSTVKLAGKTVGVIEISHKNRPVFLKKDFGKLKRDVVYIRRGSSTTEAKPDEVFAMGKKVSQNLSTPDIKIEFSDRSKRCSLGGQIKISVTHLNLPDRDEIPEFIGDEEYRNNESSALSRVYSANAIIKTRSPNEDYYRELSWYHFAQQKRSALTFCISNRSQVLATGVAISIEVPDSDQYRLVADREMPKKIDKYSSLVSVAGLIKTPDSLTKKRKKITFEKFSDKTVITINIEKVLPSSTVYVDEVVNFLALDSYEINLSPIIYGDNIPTPIKQDLTIYTTLVDQEYSLETILNLENSELKSAQ